MTEDNTTLAKKILHKAERIWKALRGKNLHETKGVETLLKKTIKLYNKAIVQVGKGKVYQTIKAKPIDKEKENYSIRIVDGKEIVVIDTDQNIFDGNKKSDYPKIIRRYMLDKFKNKVVDIGDSKAYIPRQSIEEYSYPANARVDKDIKAAKMKAGTELDNLLKTAEYLEHQEDDGRHADAVRGWDKYKTRFIVDGRTFESEISIKLTRRGDVFYDMTKIKDITPGMSRSVLPTSSQSDVNERTPSTISISDENKKVNAFDEKSTKNVPDGEIRRSRRAISREDVSTAVEDTLSAMLLTSLRPYLHSIDLSAPSIKADVQQKYGKQNNTVLLGIAHYNRL